MTSADKLQWPQGNPLFETSWRAVSEALAGNGIISQGDLEVTPTTNPRELEVAAGSVWYDGAEATLGAPATDTFSAGDADNDRWDLVAFDTDTESVVFREGTVSATPEPPDLEANEILLAIVYTPAEFDDVYAAEDVHSWRTMHQTAGEVRLEDTEGNYNAGEVEAAFAEVFEIFVNVGGDVLNGPLDLTDFAGSAVLDLGEDPGTFGAVVDADVTDAGTHSYTLSLNGTALLTITGEGDGAGGVSSVEIALGADLVEGGATIWDTAEGHVPPVVRSDMGVEDLTAEDGTITIWDQSQGLVPREQVDRRLLTHTITGNYTTDGEELILADPSGGAITLTLATADVDEGAGVQVVDISGAAASNPITVETEGGESIDGESTFTVDTEYGGVAVRSDGTNWYTAGGTAAVGVDTDAFNTDESGSVAAGNSGIVYAHGVPDGDTLQVLRAGLLLADGQAAPSDLDLVLATLDGTGTATKQADIVVGDGSVQATVTGEPLAEYENASGGEQTVAVLVDNGNFNAGTGSSQDVVADAQGEVV